MREINLIGFRNLTINEMKEIEDKLLSHFKPENINSKAILKEISSFTSQKGNYFPKIDSLVTTNDQLNIFGNSGPISIIRSIIIEPDSAIVQSIIQPIFFPKVGDVFFPLMIDRISLDMLDQAVNQGLPFLSVKPNSMADEINKDTIAVDLNFKLDNFTVVRPQKLKVIGNHNISEKNINQIADIRSNYLFSKQESDKIKQRLMRSGYFFKVSEPTLELDHQKQFNWQVSVEEKLVNQFDGIVGYVPETNQNGNGYFTGLINVNMRNFLGNTRKLNLKWLKEDKNSQEIYTYFQEPWIFSYPFDFSFEFHQRNQDTLYLKRNLNYTIAYHFYDQWSVGASFNTEFINDIRSIQSSQLPDIFNTEKYLLGFSLSYDSRDNPFNPRKGTKITLSNQSGKKLIVGVDSIIQKYSGNKTQTISSSEINVEHYFSFSGRHILANRMLIKLLDTENLELTDLFQFGGIQNLRGYRDNQFQGNKIALLSSEYRFLISDYSYFMTFFDVGFIGRPEMKNYKLSAMNDIYPSFGLGALVNSAIGNIRLIFAMGKGDTFSTSKVHIGLQNDF